MIFTFILRFLFTFNLSYINDYQLFETMTMTNLPQNLEQNPPLGHFCGYIFPILKALNFIEITYALNCSGKIQYNRNGEHDK